ncbi:4-phosphoerythronate dehydrogenase [Aurantivibrio plasticivorans]
MVNTRKKIVADENIPLITEFFSEFGDVITMPPRSMTADLVADADALIVRSVVKIGRELLESSKVKFVATCTAGFDHFDTHFFDEVGIQWSSAPGCNANSVVQYVLSSLVALKESWSEKRVGIVGCGNVGARLYKQLVALGADCIGYDPLIDNSHGFNLASLDDVLSCDVVSLHTPLTVEGSHPTYHLLNEERLQKLKQHAILISAGRGAVVDNHALRRVLEERKDLRVVLDVWEQEPSISTELLDLVNLGTPHIAGHSVDGKILGTEMAYKAFCQFVGVTPTLTAKQFDQWQPESPLIVDESSVFSAASDGIRQVYDTADDANRLRGDLTGGDAVNEVFDRLRKQYPYRREFHNYQVRLKDKAPDIKNHLEALGFQVV